MIYKTQQKNDLKQTTKLDKGRCTYWLASMCVLLLLLVGCENSPQRNTLYNVDAAWDSETATLKIAGKTSPNENSVEIHDAADGSLLGMAVVKEDGSWTAVTSTAACDIHVALPEGTTTFTVQNAPNDCTSSASYARVISDGGKLTSIEDIPSNVLVADNPVLLNTVPNAVILNPPRDVSINVGQLVNFQGVAVGTGVQPPFSFFWNFGGAAANSAIQNPGYVRFDRPGTYFIQLSASDNLGVPDPTPAIRTITVNDPNSPIGVVPVPSILSPTAVNGSVSVNVGETLFFTGTATDSSGSSSFTYEWNFSGIYPTQFGATAGSIPFNQQGVYVVSLYATNALGIRSTTPATVTVNVSGATGFNQAPDGSITRPRNDVSINAGESLNFRARGQDPDNTMPLYYSWDFQGVAPNITRSTSNSAGSITFNTPGVYTIRMTVSDSLGAVDPNPPVRRVTVLNTPNQLPPNGVLSTQIVSPPSDLTLTPGQSAFFSGQVFAPANVAGQVQYYWNFGGAAVDSNLLTPGSITFPIPGQYFVSFYARDAVGNILGQPAYRTVTVVDPSNVEAVILSPVDRSTVAVGEAIDLSGQVDNRTGFTVLTYDWVIKKRGSPTKLFTSTVLDPGRYIFQEPGDYVVRFNVRGRDANGNSTLASRAKSRITVVSPAVFPPAPGVTSNGISQPTSNMVIYAGGSVNFEATNIPGLNVSYNWDFNGVRSPSNSRRPGAVTFNTPGTYYVSLRTIGAQVDFYDQRIITVLQQNPSFPPSPIPIPGAGSTDIQFPVTDQTIAVGETISFSARTVTGTNIAYNWDFNGARSPTTIRVPGAVRFNTPGTFLVTLLVTGYVNGIPVNNYDQRVISVMQSTFPIPFPNPNPVPLGTGILAPATDRVINVGGVVDFEASNISAANAIYNWDFAGVRSATTERNPPPTRFNFPGSFLISVQISGTSFNGLPINVYDHRVVTVLQSNAPPPIPSPPVTGASLPDGTIVEPSQSSINVRVGQSINFRGSGFDPQGIGALKYQWSFGGALRNIVAQNPGAVSFNRSGTYVVTLLVQNAIGQYDPTPPTIIVNVSP